MVGNAYIYEASIFSFV